MPDESHAPFVEALEALLDARHHPAYNPNARLTGRTLNTSLLARQMPSVNREVLRKAISGERRLDRGLLEAIAAALDVSPGYFAEYRQMVARDLLDPDVVGFDQAVQNEQAISAFRAKLETGRRQRQPAPRRPQPA